MKILEILLSFLLVRIGVNLRETEIIQNGKMKYNADIHKRKSTRLDGYDYSKEGKYFITICTQNRLCLFGDIVKENMNLNSCGYI